jgi:hypothetical protein
MEKINWFGRRRGMAATSRNKGNRRFAQLLEEFPPGVREKIGGLREKVIAFGSFCSERQEGGRMVVDEEALGLLEEIRMEISGLAGQRDMLPGIESELVHVVRGHGNALVKELFLGDEAQAA